MKPVLDFFADLNDIIVFLGVNAIFIRIRSSGNFAATTRIPSSRAPGSYHVGARCGGGSFGNITLHIT